MNKKCTKCGNNPDYIVAIGTDLFCRKCVPLKYFKNCNHFFVQKYDERRGCGNGEQYCHNCGVTVAELIQKVIDQAKKEEREKMKEEWEKWRDNISN